MVKLFSKNSNLCDHNSPTSQTETWYAVAEWYEAELCDREVVGSTPPVAAVYQRLLSVLSLRGRLMNSSLRATG